MYFPYIQAIRKVYIMEGVFNILFDVSQFNAQNGKYLYVGELALWALCYIYGFAKGVKPPANILGG